MKMKRLSLNNNALFFTNVFFALYWTTAFPAELYEIGEEKNSIYKICYFINEYFFYLKYFIAYLKIDTFIGPLIAHFLLFISMGIISSFILNMVLKTVEKNSCY